MALGLAFWIIMLIWFVFGIYNNSSALGPWLGNHGLIFILFLLLGWKVFGPPLHG